MFFDMSKYIYPESILNTLYIEIKHNIKDISFGQNKWHEKCPLFSFHEHQLVIVLLLICDSYTS